MYIIIIIIVIYSILIFTNNQYYWWYPSINTNLLGYGIAYPDNINEIPIILNHYISKRTKKDIDFFFFTDYSIIPAFNMIIPESEFSALSMHKLLFNKKIIEKILIYKLIYNRARPSQVAPKLINYNNGYLLKSKTSFTPSYPSGHAFQAYYLAIELSKKFPEKKEQLDELATNIANARIIAGLHFPSDRDFAKWLVNMLF